MKRALAALLGLLLLAGSDPPAARKARLGRANGILKQGALAAAAASYREQVAASPDAPAPHVGLGKALARMGSCDEALEHLWPYVGTVPFNGGAALAASNCAGRMGLTEDALSFDRLAVELDPTSARALTNLALDLATAGDDAGVAAALDELLLLRPDRDASSYARAVLALRAGDLDAFDHVVREWERDEGPSVDSRRLRAQAWLDAGDPLAALATLDELEGIRNGQQARSLRAEAERRLGATAEAGAALADRPQSVLEGVDSDAIRARVLTDEGRFDAAGDVLSAYDVRDDPELVASAWYLASREGREAELPALEADYAASRESPLRDLAGLEPWAYRE